jgi:hypothetical protein
MKGFFKGFFVCAFVLLLSNFIRGYMGNWTYEVAKAHFSGEEKVDSLSDEDVNLSIAKVLQEKYGADSLMVSSIGSPLTKYEYYVSGVKGTKELSDKAQRMKKVSFSKGSLQYRVNVFYNCTDGSVVKIENDDTPLPNTDAAAITPITPVAPTAPVAVNTPTPPTKPTEVKDTTNANNHNVGNPSNGGSDYNNNSDV